MFEVKIIADSIRKSSKDRLTTFLVTFPRIILPEVLTHRQFSRNTSSHRAVPFNKVLEVVENNPFIPIAFQKSHKGMQGYEYFTYKKDIERCRIDWLQARDKAIETSKELYDGGVTKQLCNRLLEPFMWCTMIITTSEEGLRNFFELRCPKFFLEKDLKRHYFKSEKDFIKSFSKSFKLSEESVSTILKQSPPYSKFNESTAEIHIQKLAEMMYDAYRESKPKELEGNEWHIPYGDRIEEDYPNISPYDKIEVATSMVARVSYTTIGDGKKLDIEKHKELYQLLIDEKHCFTKGTEILTKEGWKYLEDITYNDYIASVNTSNGYFEGFEKPIEVISTPYEGDIYQYPNGFGITPNHKMLGNIISREKDRFSSYESLSIFKPSEIIGNSKKENAFRQQIIFTAPRPYENIVIGKDYFYGCLVGFFLGDGYLNKVSPNQKIKFRLKKERKINYLRELLSLLNIQYIEKVDSNGVSNFYCNKYGFNIFYTTDRKKYLPQDFLDKYITNISFLNGLFEGLKNSDGCIKRKTWMYDTYSKELAFNILNLCPLVGLTGKLSPSYNHYRIHFTTNNRLFINDTRKPNYKVEKQFYKGYIHCVDIGNKGIIVRKGNEVMITHNSSPLEHCAACMDKNEYYCFIKGMREPNRSATHYTDPEYIYDTDTFGHANNFRGFIPLRYMIDNNKDIKNDK